MVINYDSKIFRLLSSSGSGKVDENVRFFYHQEGDMIWGEYSGGPVKRGHLLGKVDSDGKLTFAYHHITIENQIQSGNCISTPELMPNGKLRLHETWQWTSGDKSSGKSVVEEVV